MYDMIIANLLAGSAVIEPEGYLDRAHIDIGFSNISSETQISKWFMVKELPDWTNPQWMDEIRARCVRPGVKINFYTYGQPHRIAWESAEMKNKMDIWANYADQTSGTVSAFEYRSKRKAMNTRERIINSTMYLNVAELDYKRTLGKVTFFMEVVCSRDEESLVNIISTIKEIKRFCGYEDIKLVDLRINLIDWMQSINVFSLKNIKEIKDKIRKKVLTDDIMASFQPFKQGRIGDDGISLGVDVMRKEVVMYLFKADPNKVENWLISATSGGGKSFFTKSMILWLIGAGFVVTVMDYEGDEYTNIADFMRQSNPDDVKVVSMGKGSTLYCDPMPIPALTGDPDIDDELKEVAMGYTLAHFRTIVAGPTGTLTKWQESVMNTAITRAYESKGVTDDKSTWKNSEKLRLKMVYEEVVDIVANKEFVDDTMESVKHKAAVDIKESCEPYFEPGGAKSGTFRHPIRLQDLLSASFIDFSFGMKGATNSQIDPTILALKQLSVANISIQISNYCKYVKHCFNVKVWEEYQRWGNAAGSAEIIGNSMTGGRKRGDINFIITNDLAAMLDDNNPINKQLRQNISTYCIGKIKDKDVIKEFCRKFSCPEVEDILIKISKANKSDDQKKVIKRAGSRYDKAFCLMLDNGKKAVVKCMLPKSMAESKLFATGVVVGNVEETGA